ncbi:MAG: response regulator [Verrucomicrobiota bacterium]
MQSEKILSQPETTLPGLQEGRGVERHGQQATAREHPDTQGKAAAAPLNVLIVEDRASDAQLMVHELKKAGFDPQWKLAENEAEYLAQLNPSLDLILSDFHMPVFNAWEALRLLSEQRLDVPFIVVTGSVGEEVAMKLVRAGAADYLLKDRLARLGEAVKQAITLRNYRRQKTAADEAIALARALAEHRLADMEALMEAVPSIVFISHDRECRRMAGNRLGRKVLRLPADANLSKTAPPGEVPMGFQAMKNGTPILPEELPLQQAAKGREIRDYEMDLVFSDGSIVTIIGNASTLRDENGKPRGAVGAFVDITERKRAEEKLQAAKISLERAKEAAEEASRAKDRFLAVLSHELRTPLTPILALTSTLAEDASLGDAVRGDLQIIERNVELEAHLIDDLLDVTRIVHGKINLDKRPVDLCEVIRRVVEVCREDIKVRRIHFGVKTEGEPYPILADATRLQQVFWNLLKNALKFTPEDGCIGIQCRRARQSVVVEVKDSGKGIAAEDLGRIFNPFEQIERSESGARGGLGLGLAISKGVVEMHEGTIEAKSEGLGLGATFCVSLPLAETVAPVVAGPAVPLPLASSPVLRILLVEDHGDTARVLGRLLRNQGHEVRTAADLQKALEWCRQWEFDLLISDLGLPDGTGLDLMRQLRSLRPEIPGIALSGYGTEEDIRQSYEAGFAEHLIKPIEMDRLWEAIYRIANAVPLHPPGRS